MLFISLSLAWSKKVNVVANRKHFNKELVMTKVDDENSERSTKCLVCDNTFVYGDVKVKDHY